MQTFLNIVLTIGLLIIFVRWLFKRLMEIR